MIIEGTQSYTVAVDGVPTREQAEVLEAFAGLLLAAGADGGRKRAAGVKVSWTIDREHRRGIYSHLGRWQEGERIDADSGAHPLVHVAWRALAVAWQEVDRDKRAAAIDAAEGLTTGAA